LRGAREEVEMEDLKDLPTLRLKAMFWAEALRLARCPFDRKANRKFLMELIQAPKERRELDPTVDEFGRKSLE